MPGAQPTPAAEPTAPPEPQQQTPTTDPAPDGLTATDLLNGAPKPPWGSNEEFDPQRAWNLIQNLRTENADYKAKADPILAEHERLRQESLTENERLKEDIGNTSAERDAWKTRAVRSVAESIAAEKFSSANAALAMIGDLSEFATADGVDANRLQQRFDQLAIDEPGLVKQAVAQGFTPNRGQGQSGTGAVPIDAQIDAAMKAGKLEQAIALKQHKFYSSKK
jgi:hypothetical protein